MHIYSDTPSKDTFEELQEYSTLTKYLLNDRGIKTKEDAEEFLSPDYEKTVRSLFSNLNLKKAGERIAEAVKNNEVIGIYSDYDCDGIPGAAALYTFLSSVGHTKLIHYTPNRNNHGFGINKDGIKTLLDSDVGVIITIDCGSASFDELAKVQKKGVDVIVIDHHIPKGDANAIHSVINPFINEDVPVDSPCAAGLVYLLILYIADNELLKHKKGQEKWLLDLIGLSTIADMVPLVGTNRALAQYGLQVLRKTERPGLRALIERTRIKQPYITEKDISFSIAPRINAASRMSSADIAFKLLTTDDTTEAYGLVDELERLNAERKTKITNMVRTINTQTKYKSEEDNIWVFGHPDWQIALAGLAAQRAMEKYKKTIFVWGRDANDNIKGSCRSYGGINLIEIMKDCEDAFEESGGHIKAGGFTLKDGAVHTVEEKLNSSKHSNTTPTEEKDAIDAELTLQDMTPELLKEILSFAPYGMNNTRPLLRFPRLTIHKINALGRTGVHTQYILKDGNKEVESIHFFNKPKIPAGEAVDIVAHIGSNWKGEAQLEIVKMKTSYYN